MLEANPIGIARQGHGTGWWISLLLHGSLFVAMWLLPVSRPPLVASYVFIPLMTPARTAPAHTAVSVARVVRHIMVPRVRFIPKTLAGTVIQLPPPPKVAVPVRPDILPIPMPVVPAPALAVVARQTPFDTFLPAKPAGPVRLAKTAVTEEFGAAAGVAERRAPVREVSAAGFGDWAAGRGSILQRPARREAISGFVAARTEPAEAQMRSAPSHPQFGSVAVVPEIRPALPAGTGAESGTLQILSKPRPAYTDEARRLRIEGEVLLETWFGASGQIRVLRVVRSLGHGLDQTAIEAAEGIRFVPREQRGQPTDTVAMIKITFSLAY